MLKSTLVKGMYMHSQYKCVGSQVQQLAAAGHLCCVVKHHHSNHSNPAAPRRGQLLVVACIYRDQMGINCSVI